MTPSFKNIPCWVVFLCCDQFCKAKGLLTLWRLWEMLQLLNCFCRFYFPAKNESWERHCGPGLTPFIQPTARVPLTQNSLWNILSWKSIFSKYLGSTWAKDDIADIWRQTTNIWQFVRRLKKDCFSQIFLMQKEILNIEEQISGCSLADLAGVRQSCFGAFSYTQLPE